MQHYYYKFCPILLATFLLGVAGTVFAETEEGRVATDIWSGYWWPTSKGEILAPLGKYDLLTNHKSAAWERANNPSGSNVPSWFGLCHGWASSSVMDPEPKKTIKSGDQILSVGDQKGLLAVCHSDDVANIYGDRFGDGVGSEAQNDITPDELWVVLRRYIKDQKIAVVLDLESGPEVWNYPAFAYRVEHAPIQAGNPIHQGTISVWFADDAVPKNFVGLKRIFQRYHFQVEMRGGSMVMGTGKWIKESAKNHPDFAWSPYVVRSSNPEVKYDQVCQLLGRQAPVPPPTPVVPDPTPQQPVVQDTDTVAECLTLPQLMLLLEGKKSDFIFDISAARYDGKYSENDILAINGVTKESGYLYLFGVDPNGKISLLYPQPEDDNRVEAEKSFTVPSPNASYQWRLTQPYGDYRIKGIVTKNPLRFAGEYAKPQSNETEPEKRILDWNELLMRVMPTEGQLSNEAISRVKGGDSEALRMLQEMLGRFSQDEVIINVGPAK
jgi:hypothetical protein